MEDAEFRNKLRELHPDEILNISIYWGLDENNNVMLDTEEITREFESKLKGIEELLK